MTNVDEPWQPLLDILSTVKVALPGPWDWDHRLKCVTTSFDTPAVGEVRGVLAASLSQPWSSTTLAQAPEAVRAFADKSGGLRPGQEIYGRDPVNGLLLYGLWWPWGGGKTISIRLGIANSDRPKDIYPMVRAVFGITGTQAS